MTTNPTTAPATDDQVTDIGDHGRWEVLTETSRYEIDLDTRTVTRLPDQGAGDAHPDDPRLLEVSQLRRDRTPIPLLAAPLVRVGQPLLLTLDVRGDGITTLRRTTTVCSVRPLT